MSYYIYENKLKDLFNPLSVADLYSFFVFLFDLETQYYSIRYKVHAVQLNFVMLLSITILVIYIHNYTFLTVMVFPQYN